MTANIAVDLRTLVAWRKDKPGRITFVSGSLVEEHNGGLHFETSRFPLLCHLVRHLGITSGVFGLETDIPQGSGLGGSALLVIAFLALAKTISFGSVTELDWPKLLILAHMFENWLGISRAGFQDQLAGLYGGANLWKWGTDYDSAIPFCARRELSCPGGAAELGTHILLAYTGEPHNTNESGAGLRPLPRSERDVWTSIAHHTAKFAEAIEKGSWTEAASHLNGECALRQQLSPQCLSPRARMFVAAARESGAGSRYTGHGEGGCVWACGEQNAITLTEARWREIAHQLDGAWVQHSRVAERGLIIE